jgi:hypothetical protein
MTKIHTSGRWNRAKIPFCLPLFITFFACSPEIVVREKTADSVLAGDAERMLDSRLLKNLTLERFF